MKQPATRRRRPASRPNRDRRGVLLLVVLSLLVLFLLVGTTFLVTSGQYRTASKVIEKANRTTFQPADLLERALMQLVRDTNSSQSAIRHHSLLRDLYGTDGFVGRIMVDVRQLTEGDTGNNPPGMPAPIGPRFAGVDTTQPLASQIGGGLGTTMGQIVEFFVVDIESTTAGSAAISDDNAVGVELDSTGVPVPHRLAPLDGYYEGSLLTMLSGPCRGSSVRVLDYDYIGQKTINSRLHTIARLRVMAPRRFDGGPLRFGALPSATTQTVLTDFIENGAPRTLTAPATTLTGLGHSFVVNGRPFNGAGVGYNPLALSSHLPQQPAPRLSMFEKITGLNLGMELALAPNSVHFQSTQLSRLTQAAVGQQPPLDPFADGLVPANFANVAAALYPGFAGLGDTDESYDAPDYQNMALASQALEPRLRGRVVYPDSAGPALAGTSVDPDAYYPNSGAPAYLDLEGVTIPSFHRPDLANFWFHRLWRSQWLRDIVADGNDRVRAIVMPLDVDDLDGDGNTAEPNPFAAGLTPAAAAQIAAIKRKFILRPLHDDHPGFDGSNPLSRYATDALRRALLVDNRNRPSTSLVNTKGNSDLADDEITFPFWEAVGPWDVDNDGDGVPDSVWVDIGLPVQQTEDGRHYKPLVAMLVEDLDGRLNLNAHGSEADLASLKPLSTDFVNDYSNVNGNVLRANLALDSQRLGQAIAGSPGFDALRSSDQLPPGTGWGAAETSLRPILSPALPALDAQLSLNGLSAPTVSGDPQYDDYARLLYGRPDPRVANRNVAAPLQASVTFGRYGSLSGTATTYNDQMLMLRRYNQLPPFPALPASAQAVVPLVRPGLTFPIDATVAPDPRTVSALRDPRTPLETLGYPSFPGYFGATAQPSGFSSPPDLHRRYATGLSGVGSSIAEPVYEANYVGFITGLPQLTWRELPTNTPDDSPYELDLSSAARKLEPASLDAIRRSYDPDGNNLLDVTATPLVDDAPFSPAELERLLRAFDADAQSLPDRLWNLTDAFDPSKLAAATKINEVLRATGANPPAPLQTTSLEEVAAAAQAAINRRVVTTDSWDLPAPNENWTDRLILGADGKPGVPEYASVGEVPFPSILPSVRRFFENGVDDNANGTVDELDEAPYDDDGDGLTLAGVRLIDEGDEAFASYNTAQAFTLPNGRSVSYTQLLLAGCDDYVLVMRQDPPSPARITDYLKYRITLELLRKEVIDYSLPLATYRATIDRLTNQILFGESLASNDPRRTTERFTFGGLLAPEVLAGRKMDLNRPFGDGRDNNGNGVVDEPQEAGEPYTYRVDRSSDPDVIRVVAVRDLDNSGASFASQDLDQDGVLYIDTDNDGVPDRFDFDGPAQAAAPGNNPPARLADLADYDGDGVFEPVVDHLWVDDNANGVRDPNEFRPFSHVRGADANAGGVYIDADNDGVLDANEPVVRDDGGLARQLFARHLYCLALALTDENYLAPYDPDDLQSRHYLDPLSGPPLLPGQTAPALNEVRNADLRRASVAYQLALELFRREFRTEIAGDLLSADNGASGTIPLSTGGVLTGDHTRRLVGDAYETRRLRVLNQAIALATRKLTCRRLAQWAVNVVDFRDPDSTQTHFEYDENPWDGWNVVDRRHDRVYPLDGDLATDENLTMVRPVDRRLVSTPVTNPRTPTWEVPQREFYVDASNINRFLEVGQPATRYFRDGERFVPDEMFTLDQSRGVVWGAERPEVLLTEAMAWHDRRLEDLGQSSDIDGGQLKNSGSGGKDDDLDQPRKPKGYTYLEAYNPWLDSATPPAELYSFVNRQGRDPSSPLLGVRFDRLSDLPADPTRPQETRSPVWRVVCVEDHPLLRNATPPQIGIGSLQAADDPPVDADSEYFNYGTAGQPFAYEVIRRAGLQQGGIGVNVDIVAEKSTEFVAALGTAADSFVDDFDGLSVRLGVFETPLTLPDTAFPSFDPMAQPRWGAAADATSPLVPPVDISIPSGVAQTGQGPRTKTYQRSVVAKPNRFIERVFYLAAPYAQDQNNPNDDRVEEDRTGPSGGDSNDPSGANLSAEIDPRPDLVNPGYRIPNLAYEIKNVEGLTATNWPSLRKVERELGVTSRQDGGIQGSGGFSLTVRASKFATINLIAPDNPEIPEDNLARLQPVPIAPLAPGRRAVLGTAGAVYKPATVGTVPRFAFDNAASDLVGGRFTTVLSRIPDPKFDQRKLPRFEMAPSPNPERHQFAVRLNGGPESGLVSLANTFGLNQAGTLMNVTVGEGIEDPTGEGIRAIAPVIAVPVADFSVSEPLDGYLLRLIELNREPAGGGGGLGGGALNQVLGDGPLGGGGLGGGLGGTVGGTNTIDYTELREYRPHGFGKGPVPPENGGDLSDEGMRTSLGTAAEGRFVDGNGNLLPFDEPFDVLPELIENQTTPNYRSLHLERLADPTLPWNPPAHFATGEADPQHDPAMPVNPYLPVDATPVDLTALNGATDAEKENLSLPTGGFNGPELRHYRNRPLVGQETVFSLLSKDRSQPLGPFPTLWALEPARLLWRQARGTTLSELVTTQVENGLRERPGVNGGGQPSDPAKKEYDSNLAGGGSNAAPYVPVSWGTTLGFASRLWGEFYTASDLRWASGWAGVSGVEGLDLNGDGQGLDLIGAPAVFSGVSPAPPKAPDPPASPSRAVTTPELAWPNRPFASVGELLQVPAWGGSRMLTYFSVFDANYTQNPHFTRRTQVNPYDGEGFVMHDGLDFNPENLANIGTPDGDFANEGDVINEIGPDFWKDINGIRRPQARSTNALRFRDMLGHYGHLMNFFQTARFPAFFGQFARLDPTGKPEEAVVPRGASNLYRLLDYVYVPSRFTATDTLLNADVFGPAGLAFDDPRLELAAPFNRVDSYREPGRVNLNTIVGRRDALEPPRMNLADGSAAGTTVPRLPDYWSEVYDGLMHRSQDGSLIDYPSGSLAKQGHLGPAWRDVALSRRGYVQPGFDPRVNPTDNSVRLSSPTQNQVDYSPMRLHPDFPTLFANPFRAPGEGANVPLVGMVQTGVDATLLRAHPLSPGADGAWGRRGVDDFVNDKGLRRLPNNSVEVTGDLLADLNGNRDDAAEAGVLPMQVGGSSVQPPAMLAADRLSADVVLARYSPTSGLRGRIPDTFLQDAYRPTLDSVDPRSVSPRQSLDPNDPNYQPIRNLEPPTAVVPDEAVSNSEIAKRSTPVPLFSGASLEPSLDTERNATQRYLPIQRLSNLATTRSNVYAVWITVGFFEVKPAKDDPRIRGRYFQTNSDVFLGADAAAQALTSAEFFRVYPDGWTLGEELGRDTGGDRRHRGFYVVDRSRPVAFKPGEDANVSDTVLLRRRIE